MVSADKIAKQTVKPVDDYLKFIQQSFNTDDVSFKDIVSKLKYISKSTEFSKVQRQMADDLGTKLGKIKLLKDPDKYNKFDKLADIDLSSKGLYQTYVLKDDILKDIDIARDWLTTYKEFNKLLKNVNREDLHEELLVLGQSILGRAIELCPKDTGYLRSTGVLMDFGSYIIIAFLAPYATYVHENLEITHPYHPYNCGGQAKFLERALQEFFPDKTVWVEHLRKGEVSCKIAINPKLLVEYTHYGS